MKVRFGVLLLGIGLVFPLVGDKVVFAQADLNADAPIELAQAETQNVSREAEVEKAKQLNQQGEQLYQQGDYASATAIFEQVLEIRQRLYKGDHSSVALSLNNLALLYKNQGRYEEAEPLFTQAIEMYQRLHKGDHSSVASSLNNLALLYQVQGRHAEAEPLFQDSLEMRQRLFPEEHPSIASSLNNLAFIYQAQGRHAEAEPLFQDVLALRQRLFPEDHNDLAISFNNLALLYHSQGRYAEAEPLLKRALEMWQRLFTNDHYSVAHGLNNLAGLYDSQGRYAAAEPLYEQAVAMLKRLFPDDHPSVAQGLSNLAFIYQAQGRYAEAEPLLKESLEMYQQLFPDDHPSVATSFNNIALLYQSQGRYVETEPLLKESLEMYQRLFPDDHPEVALPLNNLALLYKNQGRYEEAEPFYQDALAMWQRLFPYDHPYVATSISNLALFYSAQGRHEEAESLIQEALEIRQRLFPSNHPDVAQSLSNSGLSYQAQGKYLQALDYLAQAVEVEEAIIAENLVIGSEQQKKQFLDLFQTSTFTTISFHLTAVPKNRQAAELALTTILRRKGRVLDAMGQTLQSFRDNLDDDSVQLLTDLTDKQSQLTNLAYKPLPNDPTQRKNVQTLQADLDKEIKTLEAKLSSRSAEFAQTTTPVTIEQIQQSIPANAALAEFIQYRPFDAKEQTFSEPRYAVYVLMPNGEMQWQDLGEAAPIDAQIKQFRKMLGSGERGGLVPEGTGEKDKVKVIKQAARELDKLLMQPVRAMTGDATHLLLSPDSQLNTLPFAALVDEEDNYLVQNYLITYLTSGRDLLRLQLNQDQPTTEPLVLANPTYSAEGIATKENSDKRGRRSAELSSLNDFQPLPATEIEGAAIKELIPESKLLTETAASENNLKNKQNQNPEFLHLATHGFFLAPEEEPETTQRDIGTIDNQPVFSTAENPFLRSGLALAGFNQRKSGTEDGVLTALEVTGLNLRGTKLVVTSACETGLGDVQAGEGIYGLRRAFTLAGAQSQLMSLWKVSDDGTKDLMVEYYNRIQNGEARGEALRQVQLKMLESEDRNHPFYWAAFIPSGSWLPLN